MKEYSFYLTADDNIFNPDAGDVVSGYRLLPSGAVTADQGGKISGFIPCDTALWLAPLDSGGTVTICCYDKGQTYISGETMQTGGYPAFPSNVAFVRVSGNSSDWEDIRLLVSRLAAPVYSDSLSKDYEKENDNQFFRAKLNGKLAFVGTDYDYIAQSGFDTVFRVAIYRKGQSSPYFTGTFMKTDGEWDEDGRKCEVELTTDDGYADILAGMENEYDLLELAPETERCALNKRPLLQTYTPGDNVVMNSLGKVYWEQEVNEAVDVDIDIRGTEQDELVSKYKFQLANILMSVEVISATSPYSDAIGIYTGKMVQQPEGSNYSGELRRQGDDKYYISFVYNYALGTPSSYLTLRDSQGNPLFFRTTINMVMEDGIFSLQGNNDFAPGGTAMIDKKSYYIYTRLLLDVDKYPLATGDQSTYPVPDDDLVADRQNYRRVIGWNIDYTTISVQTQYAPTEWGKAENGQYFVQPSGGYDIPVARSEWKDASIWGMSSVYQQFDEAGRKPYLLRDAYPLSSCISVLLHKVAPSLTHRPTEEYSKFLYAYANPVSGLPGETLLLTPKSNILKGEYDEPARKAAVTLKQITDMLRDCFRCYWYVEDGKFRVEHISFFNNGMTYDGAQRTIGIDLTQMINPRNGKDWGYCTSKWKFEKEQMPERYQFGWMDEVTRTFEGQPIEILSPYVEKGLTEEVTVGNFTTDIDYMLISPGEISEDGFALLWATGFKPLLYNRRYNYSIDPDTGETVDSGGYYFVTADFLGGFNPTTGFKVQPGLSYRISQAYPGAWYDWNGTFLSGVDPSASELGQPMTVTAPDNARYYVATFRTGQEDASTFTPQDYSVPIADAALGGGEYVQNPYLSFTYLQPAFYVYDLPARKALINGIETVAKGIRRNRSQEVSVPSPSDPGVQELVRTHIGDGSIDKASINLSSRMAKLTLRYDTEQ